MHRRWPLVGRTRELGLVAEVLAAGERSGIVVAGPAGAGKTRLAMEWLASAAGQGLATARVKAAQASRALPFGALAPLLPATIGSRIEPADVLWRAAEAIVALGEGRPLVLLVDDAHLLDDASATLVHQLVATRAVFVIATVRTGEPAPDQVVSLWKDELAERIELAPLRPEDIEEVLTGVLGGPVSAATLHQLSARSAGNALYLRELVLAGEESGRLTDAGGIWRLSGSPVMSTRLIELIEARLRGVHDPERMVLDSLAFGEPLGVRCLLGLTTAAKLEQLENKGLIVTAYDGRRLQASLTHPLYGEVIRARIPAFRSQVIRQRLAERLESLGARRREDALRFATFRLDAGGTTTPELMVTAAATALDRWDLTLAGRLAEAAVEAGGGFDAAMLRAEVAVLQGEGMEAETQLAALLPLASDDPQRVRVTGIRADNLISRLGRTDEALAVIDEAERLVTDPAALDQLTAKRAFALHVAGRLQEALDVLVPMLARAEGPEFGFAWYIGGACMARAGRFAEALLLCEKLARAATAFGGGPPPFRPSLEAVVKCAVFAGAGRLRDAEEVAVEEYVRGVTDGSVTIQAVSALHLARVEVGMGKVSEAARYAAEARDHFREKRWLNLARTALTELALAHALAGAADQAAAALAEIASLDLPPDDLNAVELGRARAWTAAAAGDVTTAHDELRRAVALARERADLVWESEALHDQARLGRAAEAAPRLAELAGLVEGDMAPARAQHSAALVAGDAAGLAQVSAAFAAMGAWLLAAEASAGAAVVLRRDGEARRAVAAEARAAELARRCQGAMTPALRAIQTQALLSSREIEVAALGAAGLSNKDIAVRLSVSVRTVENHLQRVYEKLGVARRADLAQALGSV
jgi:DNA-binding CsgD family transcriptional regulator/tetratricopeptide (TPR) repeat protein